MAIKKDSKTNTYYVKFRVGNKSTTKRGFSSRQEALQFLAKLKEKDSVEKNYKFCEIAEMFLEYQKNNMTYGTYARSKNMIETIFYPRFKDKYMKNITPLECSQFKDDVAKLTQTKTVDGKKVKVPYATAYKNEIIIRFKSLFNFAYRNLLIDRNPCIGIGKLKKSFDESRASINRDMQIWSIDEFNQFVECVPNEIYRIFFTTLFYTGLRIGEALALTWNDFYDSKLNIDKSVTRKTDKGTYEVKLPKTPSSVRIVSLPAFLNNLLTELYQKESEIVGFKKTWFIFHRLKPLPQASIDRVKARAITQCGVKFIRIHDFRHSHASYLIGNGMDIVAVSRRLGHSTINETLKTYSHLLQKNDDEIINLLENCSQNVVKNNTDNKKSLYTKALLGNMVELERLELSS